MGNNYIEFLKCFWFSAAIWAMDLHDRKLLEPVTYDNGGNKEKLP